MKSFFSRLKFFAVKTLVFLLAPMARRLVPSDCRRTRNLLLVRNDGLGDYLLFLPAAKQYREAFPEHRIVLFAAGAAELARRSPYFDRVIPIRSAVRHPSLRSILLFSVFPAEILVNTLHARNADSDVFAYVSPASRKFAFSLRTQPCRKASDRRKLQTYEAFYTALEPFLTNRPVRVLNGALAALAAGRSAVDDCAFPPPRVLFPFVFGTPPPFGLAATPYFAVVPGAGDPRRRWPPESFRTVVRELRHHFPGLRPVAAGTASEAALAGNILAGLPESLNLCGRLTLTELGAVLAGAAFVLSNDTGAAHYASLLGVETLVILGGGHFGSYFPDPANVHVHVLHRVPPCRQCGWFCTRSAGNVYPCVAAVPSASVLVAAETVAKEKVR